MGHPTGTIPPGEGSRFVLAATDHLHQKLTRMEARMHSLEDALAILHATDSDKPHPLLISRGVDDDDDRSEEEPTLKLKAVSEEPSSTYTQESSSVDALGSLHIDGEGASRFFGPSGGAEVNILSLRSCYICLTQIFRAYFWRVPLPWFKHRMLTSQIESQRNGGTAAA